MGLDDMILVFWMLSFKPTFLLSSFTFIKRLFSSVPFCHKGGVICISEVIDISPGNLHSSCASSRPAFLMMYSAYKLNKQGDNTQPWCTPFPIWNQPLVPCPVLATASWPTYRFLKRQVRWSGIPNLFQNFPQFIVIHTVKGFGIVNKGEIDVFLELSCFFDDPADVGNLISSSSAFSKTSLNIWKFMVHVSLKPGLENFEHYFASMWDECNCAVVWVFFGILRHSLAYVRQKVLTVLKENIQTLQDLKEWAGEFSGWLWSLLGGSFSWRGWFGAG